MGPRAREIYYTFDLEEGKELDFDTVIIKVWLAFSSYEEYDILSIAFL